MASILTRGRKIVGRSSDVRLRFAPFTVDRVPLVPIFKDYSTMSDPSDLFNYTSGRWIYNETLRLSERQLFFNVAQLNRIAAASIGRSEQEVSCIRKLAEGGFNRAFEITMRDGIQVVARLPYPSTEPRIYATASEVATMDFVRLHSVPVPRILAYSASDQNPVGSEYIVMDKAPGNELGGLWYTMTERKRLKMIFEIVKIEALLFSIQLPGYEAYTTSTIFLLACKK